MWMSLKDKLLKRKEQVEAESQKIGDRVQAWDRALVALIHFIENTLSESVGAKLLTVVRTMSRYQDSMLNSEIEAPMLTLSAHNFKVTIQAVGLILGGGRVDITGGVIGGRGHALLWDGAGQAPENWKIAPTTAQGKADRAKAKPLAADALENVLSEHLGLGK
jgi:hypothetical protein